jgi:hypothetical protein
VCLENSERCLDPFDFAQGKIFARHDKKMKFLETLVQTFANKPIDWDELEESLIRADLGVAMTTRIIKTLQEREAWSVMGINDVVKVVREEIARILPANLLRRSPRASQTKSDFARGCKRDWKDDANSETRSLSSKNLSRAPAEWIDIRFCWRQPTPFAPPTRTARHLGRTAQR